MRRTHRNLAADFAVALAATALTAAVRLVINRYFGPELPMLPFALAVVVSAWYRGSRSSFAATLFGAIAGALFLLNQSGEPIVRSEEWLRFGGFALVGAAISVLAHRLQAARRRAEDDAARAQRSERRYRALVQTTPQAVWSWGSKDAGIDGSTWWAKLTGQASAGGDNWNWLTALHPDDQERAKHAWEEVL